MLFFSTPFKDVLFEFHCHRLILAVHVRVMLLPVTLLGSGGEGIRNSCEVKTKTPIRRVCLETDLMT